LPDGHATIRPVLHLDDIVAGLAGHVPQRLPPPPTTKQRASVALVLAGPADDLRLCLIRRAQRADDPWSGHMALPGGRADEGDAHARAVATRETDEEVGLGLTDAHHLGDLDEMPLRPDRPTPAVLSPFAFFAGPTCPPLRPEPAEVADAHWIRLAHLWQPAHVTTMPWTHEGRAMKFPGIRVGDHVVWGLTLRVLMSFGDAVGQPLPLRGDALAPRR
jgi:8-oxo-dGTP pyrophosphatase MutT (NUDIX family)